MQPTGGLHIGNYLGALKNWVGLVNAGEHEALFCIVDAHAITTEYEPKLLKQRILATSLPVSTRTSAPSSCRATCRNTPSSRGTSLPLLRWVT